MRTIGVFLALGFTIMSFAISEITRYSYQQDSIRVDYGKEHGMLHTQYVSYWPNGRVKAQGAMLANMRYGEWQIFDSTSKLVLARNYETGYAWTQLYPITFEEVTSKGKFGSRFSLYVDIKPDSVLQSARIWRFLPFNNNSPIFHNNALLDTMIAMYDRGKIVVGGDDEMMVLLSRGEFYENLDKCESKHRVIGYKLKEDWYYDAKKGMGIFGIIGICPVLLGKNLRDSVDLGWISYDATLRTRMATMFYSPEVITGFPVGVEQTFFLRCFESVVYKTSNVKNYTIAQMFPDPKKRKLEEQRMEIQPFEWEHDQWLAIFK